MTEQYLELKIEELEKRIKTLEQEPCDAISREAVLKLCTNNKYNIPYEYKDDKGIIHKGYDEHGLINYYKLKYLPSVTPSRHKGHWIPVEYPTGVEAFGVKEMTAVALKCSECGKEVDISDGDFELCPYCGAEMESEE